MKYWFDSLLRAEVPTRTAPRILLASDYDGTLCEIRDCPRAAQLEPSTLDVLRRVAAVDTFTLAILSGRSLADVRSRVPVKAVFAGNHGLEIRGGGIDFIHSKAVAAIPNVKRITAILSRVASRYDGAWVENKRLTATLHYRKADPRVHSSLLTAAEAALTRFLADFVICPAKMALEVRPRAYWDKGSALRYISLALGPFDACICLGDDHTDEAMFRENPDWLNVKVGGELTAGANCLVERAEVTSLLSNMLSLC